MRAQTNGQSVTPPCGACPPRHPSIPGRLQQPDTTAAEPFRPPPPGRLPGRHGRDGQHWRGRRSWPQLPRQPRRHRGRLGCIPPGGQSLQPPDHSLRWRPGAGRRRTPARRGVDALLSAPHGRTASSNPCQAASWASSANKTTNTARRAAPRAGPAEPLPADTSSGSPPSSKSLRKVEVGGGGEGEDFVRCVAIKDSKIHLQLHITQTATHLSLSRRARARAPRGPCAASAAPSRAAGRRRTVSNGLATKAKP